MASPRSPRGARLSRPEPNLSTPRGVQAPRVVTAGLFCASRPGNYSLLSLWATGGRGREYIVVNRPNCSADPRLAPCQCQILPREGVQLVEGKSWNDDGPSALRSAPPLPASGSVEVAALEAQALVPLSSSLFIAAHPGPPANRANPLTAEHGQYRDLVGGHLSLSDPMSGHPPATAASN